MTKYQSTDIRTGFDVGKIVELEEAELNKLAFNVFMQEIEPIDEKKKLEDGEKQKKKDELMKLLKENGLSKIRRDKVLEKFGSIEELKKNSGKAGIDKLTDEFLAKEFQKSKRKGEL